MFTGLITHLAEVQAATPEGAGLRLVLDWPFEEPAVMGESIAVQGCCLTVAAITEGAVAFHLSAETLACTSPRTWQPGRRLHLERALRVGDRLGGHFVTGHVDALATVHSVSPSGEARVLALETPALLRRFLVPKGSVTLDGVSLTVNQAARGRFSVHLVPHTLGATLLGALTPGDAVHLEVDLLARYALATSEELGY